jgi:pyruvate dehydrogenase phosphatase
LYSKRRRPITNFKGPYIKSVPEIKIFNLDENDEFIVMATDGLWDYLSSGDVAQLIKNNNNTSNLQHISNDLFHAAIQKAADENGMKVDRIMNLPAGSTKRRIHDDITIILFDLKH